MSCRVPPRLGCVVHPFAPRIGTECGACYAIRTSANDLAPRSFRARAEPVRRPKPAPEPKTCALCPIARDPRSKHCHAHRLELSAVVAKSWHKTKANRRKTLRHERGLVRKWLIVGGVRMHQAQAARIAGVHPSTIARRLAKMG